MSLMSFSPPPVDFTNNSEQLAAHNPDENAYLQPPLASTSSVDGIQFNPDAQTNQNSINDNVTVVNHNPGPTSENAMEIQVSTEGRHQDGQATQEILNVLDEPFKQATASANSASGDTVSTEIPPLEDEHQHTTLASISEPALEPDLPELAEAAITSNDIHGVAFEDFGDISTFNGGSDNLNEHDIIKHAQDLVREMETEMETDPSVSYSVDAELDMEPEPEPNSTAATYSIDDEQTAEVPVTRGDLSATEPLRRMDDDTIPVTTHSKDSIIDTLDEASPAISAKEPQPTSGNIHPDTEDEAVSSSALERPHDNTVSADAPEELVLPQKVIYLEHIQVVELENPAEIKDTTINTGEPPAIEDMSVLQAENMLAPIAEVEPTSAVSTEYIIDNDPALALTEATTTIEEVFVPLQSDSGTQLVPEVVAESETVITDTSATIMTTVTTTQHDVDEQPGTDADVDMDVERTEQIRREEQVRLQQGSENITEQITQEDTAPVDEAAPKDDEPAVGEQLEQDQKAALCSVNPVVSSESLDASGGSKILDVPQHAVVLDAPEDITSTGLSSKLTSPERKGFGALEEEARNSSELIDHSSEVHEDQEEMTPKVASSSQPTLLDDTPKISAPKRKPKMIMEVVIPIPNKGKGKAKKIDSELGSSPSPERDIRPLPPRKRTSRPRHRKFGSPKKIAKRPGKRTPTEYMTHSMKVEVVMKKRPSVLRRTGSIASGNNVKFAPIVELARKRKAESGPEDEEPHQEAEGSDADAEGEIEEGYEDVEDEEDPKPQPASAPTSSPKAGPSKPVKRPRRSLVARKAPAKLPEVLTDTRRSKKRRTRR